jgi:thioredoxin reductase
MSSCEPEIFGADPVTIRWNVVRGDTSTIRVDFLNDDETTSLDTDGWSFLASAYDRKTDILDELEVESFDGYAIVTAPAETTSLWGTTYGGTVAELSFDLEITIDETVWTPVIGTISVIGDVSTGL